MGFIERLHLYGVAVAVFFIGQMFVKRIHGGEACLQGFLRGVVFLFVRLRVVAFGSHQSKWRPFRITDV